MAEKLKMSPKVAKWREWMQVIEPEIRLLLRDARVFWEIRIIIHGHQRTQDFHYGYLERSHLNYMLARLHRQIKPNEEHISFVELLHKIAENLGELSDSYSGSVRSGADNLPDTVPCPDVIDMHICPQMITEDIAQLTSALEACETFVGERLVYLERHEAKTAPVFKEFKDCLKLLDKTYVKYHVLFYGDGLKTLQPPRQAGTLKGLIKIADDFDAELPEFKEYMY